MPGTSPVSEKTKAVGLVRPRTTSERRDSGMNAKLEVFSSACDLAEHAPGKQTALSTENLGHTWRVWSSVSGSSQGGQRSSSLQPSRKTVRVCFESRKCSS